MALNDRILEDLKAAMKARDEVAKQTLRMLKSELGRKEVELGRALDESEELGVLTSAVKSRKDSIAEYEKAQRPELADAERAEIEVIQRYLPAQMDEAEARAAIESLAKELDVTEKKQMGQLMKAVMERYRGRIDGKVASRIAGSILS
ncbi:MAG TPA: GatB/YqeY domain-containing protein [Sandaracinaceae bacterium LLY-WYZ-13_1]|nr:GatB/YqeY domain-containing protein [Sandaracinaceae bacterium LLY-WYZ-13_1]